MIRAESIQLKSLSAQRAKGIQLRLTAAWRLTAPHPGFGGISAISAKGERLRAITDIGGQLDWSVSEWTAWPTKLSYLPRGCGDPAVHFDRDSESIALDAAYGTQWIGFEVRDAICRIAKDGTAAVRAPAEMRDWPQTGGPEAMVRLRDGRFLVFAERTIADDKPVTPLIIFDRDPVSPRAIARRLSYRAPLGTRPVDAAELPDGRLLVLNRRFDFPFRFTVLLAIVDPAQAATQEVLDAAPIAWFAKGLSAENWEAITIDDLGKGRARIWMASDDNFMGIQNTLLLKLEWQGEATPPVR